MAQVRSFEKPFELVDYTEELLLVPNKWGLINELGIFRNEGVAQHSITIESNQGTLGLVTDKVRGERNNVNKDDTRNLRSFAIPHFPMDDAVKPEDVQGKRAYGQADAAETEAAVIARKLERIRQSHAATLEAARAYALTTGAIYAPNGTVAGNFYTDFGVTRKVIDFALGTTTTDVLAKSEEAVAHIQDNIQSGETVSNVVVICSPAFFGKLITQAGVKEAYKYYSSTQEPLRQRLGSGLYRRFVHGGVEYIEYRGSYNGTALIPAGDAYALPVGTSDTFLTYFSPANKFDFVNTIGEEAYAFTYRDPKGSSIEVQTESNFLNLVRRPQALVRLHTSN
jgi:Phage major capsid protein E